MLQHVVTSFLAFVSTNIDDLFILMLFYGSGKVANRAIYAGQFVGIAFLVAVSFLGSLVGLFIDARFIGLLGLFPIYLAVRQAIALLRKSDDEDLETTLKDKYGVLAIAGVTIANGGDNIGVYVPLLAALDTPGKMILVMVFVLMVFVWCWFASQLVRHPKIADSMQKYGHIAMPAVLLLLGIYILAKSRAFTLFGEI